MTPAERRCAAPRFPWSDIALAPLNGVLAVVPAVVLAGLPLYLILWLAGVDEPGGWVSLLGLGAFGFTVRQWRSTTPWAGSCAPGRASTTTCSTAKSKTGSCR